MINKRLTQGINHATQLQVVNKIGYPTTITR